MFVALVTRGGSLEVVPVVEIGGVLVERESGALLDLVDLVTVFRVDPVRSELAAA